MATLAGAAIASVLLWAAAHIGRHTTGGYWAAYGVIAGAGLVFALPQLMRRSGNPPVMLTLVFLPVLVTAGWVLVAMEPNGDWFRSHVLAWSGDMGIRNVVDHVGIWLGVLAFGIGYTLGLALEPAPRVAVVVPPTHDRVASDEPVTAERNEVADREREAEPVQ
jgi:acetyl esterase/lipase